MTGSYLPFTADTILKRYADKATYLTRVRAAAKKLAHAVHDGEVCAAMPALNSLRIN